MSVGTSIEEIISAGADLNLDLRSANLRSADLRGVDLSGAILCDANFDGATVSYRGREVVVRFEDVA